MSTLRDVAIDAAGPQMPAPHVNRFQLIRMDGGYVRLQMAEAFSAPDVVSYRVAFVMSDVNAQELADAIIALIKLPNAPKMSH